MIQFIVKLILFPFWVLLVFFSHLRVLFEVLHIFHFFVFFRDEVRLGFPTCLIPWPQISIQHHPSQLLISSIFYSFSTTSTTTLYNTLPSLPLLLPLITSTYLFLPLTRLWLSFSIFLKLPFLLNWCRLDLWTMTRSTYLVLYSNLSLGRVL